MPDITEPVQVVAGKPVKASDHNTSSDAISELTAAIGTLENSQLINGSFEDDLASWVASDVGGGSHSIETTTVTHGAQSFKAVATALGGYVDLDSDDFLNVSAEIDDVFIDGRIRVTAQMQVQGWIEWFDSSDVSISTHQFMDYTFGAGQLDKWLRFRGWGRAVATARSYKLTLQLGDGTVAGDAYLDGITSRINDPYPWILLDAASEFFVAPSSGEFTVTIDPVEVIGIVYTASTIKVGSDTIDEYMFNLDTGNWVSYFASNLEEIFGTTCNGSGQLKIEEASSGLSWRLEAWR